MKRQKGQSLLEFALLLPILLILLMGLLDLGRAYYVIVTLEDMAGEGAIYAAMHPNDLEGIQLRAVESGGSFVQVDPSMVTVEYPPALYPGQPITVTVAYDFPIATPFVHGMINSGILTLRQEASEPILPQQ